MYHSLITGTGIISQNGHTQVKILRNKLTDQHGNLENQGGPKINDHCLTMCRPSQRRVSFMTELLAELPFFDPIVEDETHVIQTCPLYEDLRKKLKAPTYIVLHEDPKFLFQTSTELRDFSRFLTNIHKRRFPKKIPLKKNRSTQTDYILWASITDCTQGRT